MTRMFIILIVLIACAATTVSQTLIRVPQDQPTIQAGINAASDGDTVLVAEGTYLENIVFVGKKITVASLFITDENTSHVSKTVIDGSSPSHSDSGSVVTFGVGTDTNSVLMGFTITGGSGTLYNWNGQKHWRYGGGVTVASGGARISHNRITWNRVNPPVGGWAGGAGVIVWSWHWPTVNNWVILEDNEIDSNRTYLNPAQQDLTETGGISVFNADARIIGNSIHDNVTDYYQNTSSAGGGIAAGVDPAYEDRFYSLTIIGNTIRRNSARLGGGIWLTGAHSNWKISRNDISYNTGVWRAGGVGVLQCQSGEISSNIVRGNTSPQRGSGIYLTDNTSPHLLINNFVVKNSSTANAGGVNVTGSTAYLVNNTIAYNSPRQLYATSDVSSGNRPAIVKGLNNIFWGDAANTTLYKNPSSSVDLAYSLLRDTWAGTGNFTADPLFADTSINYCISRYSPAIDAGADTITLAGVFLQVPDSCYYGKWRGIGGTPDIGADEFDPTVGVERLTDKMIPKKFGLSQNYPNPFNPTTAIKYHLPSQSSVTLKVYDMLGRVVEVLVNERQRAGVYQAEWDAKVASGIYFYRLEATGVKGERFIETRKMVLLR